jgi:hypothetical protein
MNSGLRITLVTTAVQQRRLADLQGAFATVCNTLAPIARESRCWNRVALHHMVYKALRQKYPELGSQMVCNAIYSVSRACRAVYQHPSSPFNLGRLGHRPLPLLQFRPDSPVFFDRHTLSIKAGEVSMYTLDGRMRFRLDLSPEAETRFRNDKLREIVLSSAASRFILNFTFAESDEGGELPTTPLSPDLPEYLIVTESAATAEPIAFTPAQARMPS